MNSSLPLDQKDHLLAITSVSFDISILELLWTLCRGIRITIKGDDVGLTDFDAYLPKDRKIGMDFSLFYFSSRDEIKQNNKYDFLLRSADFGDKNNFSAIWLPERHFHEFGGMFPNPSVLGAGLATVTKNIEIRSGSIVLPLHDVVRVAEEWSMVDNLSNGRVSLSLASGWNADDFVLMQDNYRHRKSILFDQLGELRKLWRGETVKRRNGQNKEVEIKIFPRPVQKELPVWITSGGELRYIRGLGKDRGEYINPFAGTG